VYEGIAIVPDAWEWVHESHPSSGTAISILDTSGHPSLAVYAIKHNFQFVRLATHKTTDTDNIRAYVESLPAKEIASIVAFRNQIIKNNGAQPDSAGVFSSFLCLIHLGSVEEENEDSLDQTQK
jgi:hypothetical protein